MNKQIAAFAVAGLLLTSCGAQTATNANTNAGNMNDNSALESNMNSNTMMMNMNTNMGSIMMNSNLNTMMLDGDDATMTGSILPTGTSSFNY
ncbi:hypothetical protein COW46_02485 [Candidatus Gracilibacteria bacterium CG17_big_fil_post_rev_8_21_14_2_50_48_13]|nr:MAG: hypothetical protein COW46_02485 [Candidatus Gracilibacteria bacterium CG17_big_fil_post_rev_8_21_14_2_50_48_13]